MKAIEAFAADRQKIVGVLATEPRWIGRSVNGVQIFGPPSHLETLIDEFAVHGVNIDRVVVGGGADSLQPAASAMIRDACERRALKLVFVPNLLSFEPADPPAVNSTAKAASAFNRYHQPPSAQSAYFRVKHTFEICFSTVLIVVFAPIWLLGGLLTFVDVGAPILFWQRRTGRGGRDFQLYKLRTLRPAFDHNGRRIPEERRLSWIGRFLRQSRLDELPQLLSVLDGNMSLIGPRPLLPQDQPADPSMRLTVRPGITGWAQVNGGALLAPDEKEALDSWYIRHASLALDLRILAMTLRTLLNGDRRSERALAEARAERAGLLAQGRHNGPTAQAAGAAPL